MARWFPHRRPQWHRAVDERRTRRNSSLSLSPDADDLRLMVIAGSRLPEQPMLCEIRQACFFALPNHCNRAWFCHRSISLIEANEVNPSVGVLKRILHGI